MKQKQIKTKKYSSKEVCEYCDITPVQLLFIVKALRIQKVMYSRHVYYDSDSFIQIIDYVDKCQEITTEEENIDPLSKIENLEELKQLHPLVKDPHFFIEDFFPDQNCIGA